MARPRKVSPEAVAEAVDKAIKEYMETGDVQALTDYAIMQRLNISSRTLDKYYDGEADAALLEDNNISSIDREKYKKYGYCESIKRLVEFRRAECVRHIASGGASTSITGWIFLSKQGRWGGFQDVQRTETKQSGTFTVCITDSTGKPLKE